MLLNRKGKHLLSLLAAIVLLLMVVLEQALEAYQGADSWVAENCAIETKTTVVEEGTAANLEPDDENK